MSVLAGWMSRLWHSLRSPALPIVCRGCSKHMPGEPGTCFCALSPGSDYGVDATHRQDMLCWAVRREIAHGGEWRTGLQLPPEKDRGPWVEGPSKRQGGGPWQSRGPCAHFLPVPRAHGASPCHQVPFAPMHNSCAHVPICASFN